MYPDGEPFALMADQVALENFDAILFVEKTMAARRNPPVATPGRN
jgi:hypothetical protein